MEKPTWTIVQFAEDNTVEAVPSSWIEHNKCYWPPFKYEKIIAAIRKNMERNTCWPCYDIITFRNSTYDDYNTARLKTKRAECTSDLNSEVEVNAKRKKISNRLYETDTDDCNEYNSVPIKQKQMKDCKLLKRKSKIANTSQYSSEESEESDSALPNHPQMTECNVIEEISKTSTPAVLQNNKIWTNAFSNDALTPDNNYNAKYFKEIIRQQSFFKTQLWQMSDDIREVKNIITGNLKKQTDGNMQQDTRNIYFSFHLLLKTMEDIEGPVEQFLSIPENFERSVAEACTIGGTSPYDFIKRSLCRLVTNELAQQYSWFGAKQKKKFCNLRITDMLLAAGAAYSSTYIKLDLEKAIQKWLRRAKERCDAEKKRIAAHENDYE